MKIFTYALPLIRIILFIIVGYLFAVVTNQTLEQASKWWPILCIVINIITIILLVIICKSQGTTYKNLINPTGTRFNLKYTLLIVVIMIIFGIGGIYIFGFLIYGSIPLTMIQPIPIWLAIINLFLLPITIVFAELPLYFGYSLNNIDKITGNKVLAILYPMFFYALQHSFIPLIFDWQHIIFRFLSFMPLMLILGFTYYKKKNLKPLMIGHGILDLAAASQILIISIVPTLFDFL